MSVPSTGVTLIWAQRIWERRTEPAPLRVAVTSLPPPHVPDADRAPFEVDALVGAAVVFDLLATRLRALNADGLVLAGLVDAAVWVRQVGAEAGLDVDTLLQQAQGLEGAQRAATSASLAQMAHSAGVYASAPETVLAAIARLRAAASYLVDDASLHLATRGVMKTWQV